MAGRIPQSFINDLLQRVDIVEVIDARVGLKKAGRNYKACCPFHEEKTPSFNVNPDRGFYKCFGCGVAGTAITFLMEYEHLEFVEAIEALARTVGVEVPRERGRADRRPDEELYVLLRKTAGLYRRALGQHPESAARGTTSRDAASRGRSPGTSASATPRPDGDSSATRSGRTRRSRTS